MIGKASKSAQVSVTDLKYSQNMGSQKLKLLEVDEAFLDEILQDGVQGTVAQIKMAQAYK